MHKLLKRLFFKKSAWQIGISKYKIADFPDLSLSKYPSISNLDGADFRETTLFIKEGIFYFFTSINANDNLHLYTAKSLEDQLVAHPQNPLCDQEPKYSRCGGNIIEIDNKIYRFAQDCSRRYGEKLHLMEITSLSEKYFSQKHICTFLAPDIQKEDWKSRKMHHFSSVKYDNSLIFAIDGEGWESRF